MDWPRDSGLADEFLSKVDEKLRKRSKRRKRVIATGSSITLALFIAFWLVPTLRYTDKVVTETAHRQTLALKDGSSAELNARTLVETDFRYGRRIVRLERGEAFFSVAKDTAHPFRVETPVGAVEVTGTQFNVRLSGQKLEVTLLEGGVKVGQMATLSPGQQFETSRGITALSSAELERATAWRTGQIMLDGLTLAQAAARLSEFHGVEISVAPAVSKLQPGGTFPLDDLPGFLEALETALPVQVIPRGEGAFTIAPRDTRP